MDTSSQSISVDKVYSILGELYLNSRVKTSELESAYSNLINESKKLSEEYNRMNEERITIQQERDRLLAELAHLKMVVQNDKLS